MPMVDCDKSESPTEQIAVCEVENLLEGNVRFRITFFHNFLTNFHHFCVFVRAPKSRILVKIGLAYPQMRKHLNF